VAPPAQAEPTPAPTEPVGPPAGHPGKGGQRPLTATFTHTEDVQLDGILSYTGTISINNPARRPADAWRVTLMIAGGNPVSADGAAVSQDGEQVTFAPYADAPSLSPGATVTFTFIVDGILPAEPADCTVNGRACD
jgi:hypothetical protein